MQVKRFKFSLKKIDTTLRIDAFLEALTHTIQERTRLEDVTCSEIAHALWNEVAGAEIDFPDLADQIEYVQMTLPFVLWGYQCGYADGVYMGFNALDNLKEKGKLHKLLASTHQLLEREWRANDYGQ